MKAQFAFAFFGLVHTALGNYYFVTDNSYSSSTLNISVLASMKVLGNLETVTQFCRRKCALTPLCKAYHVELMQVDLSAKLILGQFNCSFFAANACNWTHVSLTANAPGAITKLWEKLDATELKPKPCIQQCKVKFLGNCTACRQYGVLQGIDCEIAPRICSEYPPELLLPETERKNFPVWPWGVYGKKIRVICAGRSTIFLAADRSDNQTMRSLRSVDWLNWRFANSWESYDAIFRDINWEIISMLQHFSKTKILIIFMNTINDKKNQTFGGLEISPRGELSLNSSLDNPPSTQIPVPILKAPFVAGLDDKCGSFWQFHANVSHCSQHINPFNFLGNKWNGTFAGNYSYLAFV